MKLTALILFMLVFASSCTIEKRVHRRGWNVQWRKHHTVNEKLESSEKENRIRGKSDEEVSQVVPVSLERLGDLEMINIEEETSVETNFDQELNSATSVFNVGDKETVNDENSRTSRDIQDEKPKEENSRGSGDLVAPITILIWALVCAILAILLFAALNSAADYIMALFFVFMAYALGIIALILLIVGVIVLGIVLTNR